LPAFSKLSSHPQTKFTWHESCNGLAAISQTWSHHFECFLQKNWSDQINFNQSVITNEGFRNDWIEIKCIQVKFLFDWRQSIAIFMPWILSVGGAYSLENADNTIIVTLWLLPVSSFSLQHVYHSVLETSLFDNPLIINVWNQLDHLVWKHTTIAYKR